MTLGLSRRGRCIAGSAVMDPANAAPASRTSSSVRAHSALALEAAVEPCRRKADGFWGQSSVPPS